MCNKIIVSDKGYLHVSPFRKEFYRSTDRKSDVRFSQTLSCVRGGEIDFQEFDNERQDLIDSGYTEVPNPTKLEMRLDYFKESGKYYSEGFLYIDRPKPGKEAESYMEFMDQVRGLLDKGELPGLVKGSRFEVLITGAEHPGGYPQIFRLEK
ncbi:hypothetical protein NW77_104 [Erwinia phage phiEa2809]|uniref:Uncharacterized protein n=1 Tax=Erwinia phage phiEa2809 TaxID=1564096 RepID=A0A0A0YR94_9CAUD|nr:hypothetical protein NW77_104 [Erwinia phage phiEa2809]AIX13112.1 hypothetical protein NW77_104 [Erwinia phage phiEa2809]